MAEIAATNSKKHRAQRFLKNYTWELHLFRHNPLAIFGLFIILTALIAGALAPVIAPFDPLEIHPKDRLLAPSAKYIMGTDDFGRDIFSRILFATRVDMLIAFSSVALSALVGTLLGGISAYYGKFIDELIMRTMDIIQSFPAFIFAMSLAIALGTGKENIIIVVMVIMIPSFARLVRSEMLSAKERGYAEAALCMGVSDAGIIVRHLLPNCLTPIIIRFALSMSYAILDAAGLSFIGLGIKPPEPEWGSMVNQGVRFIANGKWWMSVFPGLVMAMVILGFNLFSDGLRDIFDPKIRS